MPWIDAGARFARADIVKEMIHQLQHISVVWIFAHATDLGHPRRSIGVIGTVGAG
jgi:hypothetical protein